MSEVTRDDKGRWVNPPKAPIPITKENASMLAKRRWDIARHKAAEALEDLAVQYFGNNMDKVPAELRSGEGWKILVRKAIDVYMGSTQPRGMSDLAAFIGKATGMMVDAAAMKNEQPLDDPATLQDARVILQVFNYYNENMKEKDVIDGTATDA